MIQDDAIANILRIQLQFRSKVPLSDQVRKAIFDLIQRGVLVEDTPLPTVRELAAQLGVNFNTVARAYRVLDQEGWLMTRQGRGTIVTKPARDAGIDPFSVMIELLSQEVETAAASLGIEPVEVIRALTARFSRNPQENKTVKKRRRRTIVRFRAYHRTLSRSRKFRNETLDRRLRRPNL